jgi:hypothetical protein
MPKRRSLENAAGFSLLAAGCRKKSFNVIFIRQPTDQIVSFSNFPNYSLTNNHTDSG